MKHVSHLNNKTSLHSNMLANKFNFLSNSCTFVINLYIIEDHVYINYINYVIMQYILTKINIFETSGIKKISVFLLVRYNHLYFISYLF